MTPAPNTGLALDSPSPWLRRKRRAEQLVAVASGIIALPLVAGICLIVSALDRGAPLIGLTRVGHRGTELRVWKIRTMRPAAGTGSKITLGGDDRITVAGRLLRRLRFDELPQLAQIALGQMSFVGPRPEDPAFCDPQDPEWARILEARPGIAGVTQLLATQLEAEADSAEDPERVYVDEILPIKKLIDLWYVKHASLRIDALVLIGLLEHFVLNRSWPRVLQLVADDIPAISRLALAERP